MTTRRKNGEGIQLRVGQGARLRFVVQAPTETERQRRCEVMRELARVLVDQKRYEVAPRAMQGLADAGDTAEFEGRVQAVLELCSTPREDRAKTRRREVTFQDFGEMWTSGELARRFKRIKPKLSADSDVSRLKVLYQTLGPIPLSRITHAQIEDALNALPARVKTDTARRKYEVIISYLLKRAVSPCKYIQVNPIGHVEGFIRPPSRPPAYPFLFPTEDAQLLGCSDVDLGLRLLYGFTAREGWRKGDSQLPWAAFDLENGIVSTGVTKTGEVREWKLFPGTREALVAYRKGLGDPPASALVFPPLLGPHDAGLFRKNLWLAGVRRPQLHEPTPGRKAIRFHDLRASFITIALAQGRTEAWITDRTGHTTSGQMYGYKRRARLAAELGDWMPLNVALGLGEPSDQAGCSEDQSSHQTTAQESSGVAHNLEHIISDTAETDLEVAQMIGEFDEQAGADQGSRPGLKVLFQTAQSARSTGKNTDSYPPDCSESLSVPPPGGGGGTRIRFEREPLTELLDLARSSKRWHLVALLGSALDELAREEPTNVASLDAVRQRREGGK